MALYNKGTKVFIKSLKENIEVLNSELRSLVAEEVKKRQVDTEVNFKLYLDTELQTKMSMNNHVNNVLLENQRIIYIIDFMDSLLASLEEKTMFILFENLEFLFNKMQFPTDYQIDVLAYILKNNAKAAINAYGDFLTKLENQNKSVDYFDVLKEKIDTFIGIIDSDISSEQFKEKINSDEYKEHTKKIYKNFQIIDAYIDNNYKFVGSFQLEELYDAIKDMDILPLTEKQMKMIIYAVSEKQLEEINEYNNKAEEQAVAVKRKEKASIDYAKLRKEENLAIQELKNYLTLDHPIKYIGDSDLEKIKLLMIQAGYSSDRIKKIEKNINQNNNVLREKEISERVEFFKASYFNVEENEILQMALAKIEELDAPQNSLFDLIKDSYYFIRSEIMNLLDSDVNPDDIELLKLAIQELNDHLNNYLYSDYRIQLELKQN